MTDPLSQWLRAREAADARARSTRLTALVVSRLAGRAPVHVLDLATGAGSNVRHLVPRLPSPQSWLAVDASEGLLADLRARTAQWGGAHGATPSTDGRTCRLIDGERRVEIETRVRDLDALDDDLFDGRQLVTASALLDLVSASWLATLAAQCHRVDAVALFTITYNGQSRCDPVEPEDELARTLLNAHQARDKGLGGPAAGPDAVTVAVRAFEAVGYHVERDASAWRLDARDADVQRMLVDGWAQAAIEMVPGQAATFEAWRLRRHGHIDAGRSLMTVGHDDIAAWPAAVR